MAHSWRGRSLERYLNSKNDTHLIAHSDTNLKQTVRRFDTIWKVLQMGKLFIYGKTPIFPLNTKKEEAETDEEVEVTVEENFTRINSRGSNYVMIVKEDTEITTGSKDNKTTEQRVIPMLRVEFIRPSDGEKVKKEYSHWTYSIAMSEVAMYTTEAYTPDSNKRGYSKASIFLKN